MRVKQNYPIPDRAFVCGVIEGPQDEFGVPEESYFFTLRLPSYGYMYDIVRDRDRWAQRVLVYHGKYGFSIRPRFLEVLA